MYNLTFGTEVDGKIPVGGSLWINGSGIGDSTQTDFTKDKIWFTSGDGAAYIDTATGKLVIHIPNGDVLNSYLGKVANGDCYPGGTIHNSDKTTDTFSINKYEQTSYDPPLNYNK
ncbi:MAG: hypothetical protein U9R50_02245 [Campylobacterota bacterium]|nr:hypothetical protein [Campylobacterota bacterium]